MDLMRDGRLDPAVDIIREPITARELSVRVRALLDRD